jgi:hypothetical protein
MSDITTNNLEAAILDQVVAGAFAGKRYCFIASQNGAGWILGIAVQNERGYNPIDGKKFASQHEAAEWARGLNEHIGVTLAQATNIVVSTMARAAR